MWALTNLGFKDNYIKKLSEEKFEVIHLHSTDMITYTKVELKLYGEMSELIDGFQEFYGKSFESNEQIAIYCVEGWSVWSADKTHDVRNESDILHVLNGYGITLK